MKVDIAACAEPFLVGRHHNVEHENARRLLVLNGAQRHAYALVRVIDLFGVAHFVENPLLQTRPVSVAHVDHVVHDAVDPLGAAAVH